MSVQDDSDNVPLRRRGRPSGKNRAPLSLDQRRARNAQYERERRNETAEAMVELAEAAGCEPSMSNSDLLLTVINRLQNAATNKKSPEYDIDHLNRINNNLMSQIEDLEHRLNNDCSSEYDSLKHNNLKQHTELNPNPELQTTISFQNYKERTKKPKKKKIKLHHTQINVQIKEETPSSLPSEWTSETVSKSHGNPELMQQREYTINHELLNQYTAKYKPYIRYKSDQEESHTSLRIATVKQTFDQTNSQFEARIKIETKYSNAARSQEYFNYNQPNTPNQIPENGMDSGISSKKTQNPMQTRNAQEMPNEQTSILDLLTDNEKGLFGNTEWLAECEYSNPSAQENKVPETDWSPNNLIARYLWELKHLRSFIFI